MKINHVGMAVPSIDEFLQKNETLYGGFSKGPLIVNEVQGVREMFITDGNTVLELLEPIRDGSPLAGFLKRNRAGGLVHVALEVEDLEVALERVRQAGGRVVVDPVPDVAFQQRRIAFVVLNGQLSEFIELKPAPPQSGPHTSE